MKNATHQLPIKLTKDFQASLSGLNAKYAQRLEKPLIHTLHKLNRKFSKLLDKHNKVRNRKATHAAAKFLVKRLRKSFELLGTAPAARPAIGRI